MFSIPKMNFLIKVFPNTSKQTLAKDLIDCSAIIEEIKVSVRWETTHGMR